MLVSHILAPNNIRKSVLHSLAQWPGVHMLQKTTVMQSKFSPTPRSWRSTLSFHVAHDKVKQTKNCFWFPSGGNVAALYIMSVSRPGNRDSFLMEAEKAFKTDLNSEAVLRSQILHGDNKLWENYTCPNCQCQLPTPFLSNAKRFLRTPRRRRQRKSPAVENEGTAVATGGETDEVWEDTIFLEERVASARAR